jgi:N-methylhydantoinase B
VTLEIAWGRLQSLTDEAEATLIRTAFSPVIREAYDFCVMLLDRTGGAVTQSRRSMPSFVGTLPRTLRAALGEASLSPWKPGDVIATNDPWLGTGHLPDLTVLRPIFRQGEIVAYIGCVAHWVDVGGAIWSADSTELFEEGIRIPLCKLQRRGKMNEELLRLILANVRLSDQVLGDIHAQLGCLEVGAERLSDFLDDMALNDPSSLFATIEERSERAMRAAIRDVPDGTYAHEIEMDSVDDRRILLRATVKVNGDSIHVDWTGSSPQVPRAINETYNHAYAMTYYPLKCVLSPEIPNNEGACRPITMEAPIGSIINARYPAAVASRQIVGHYLPAVILGALASALPDRIIADSGSPCPRVVIMGTRPDERKYGTLLLLSGGMGGGPLTDGLSAAPFPSNAGTTSAEIVEAAMPVIVVRRELATDSGGAGRLRGGLGVITEILLDSERPAVVSVVTDRVEHPPQGRFGGAHGMPNILARSSGKEIGGKSRFLLEPGERLTLQTAGGGGFGPPAERDRELVARDVDFGYVSREAADRWYGSTSE